MSLVESQIFEIAYQIPEINGFRLIATFRGE